MKISLDQLPFLYDEGFIWYTLGSLVSADNRDSNEDKKETLQFLQEFCDSGYMSKEDTDKVKDYIQKAYKIIEQNE